MTPECRNLLLQISAYLDGDLDAAACDTIERHSATCPSCAQVVSGLKRTAGLCRQVGATPLPASVLEKARASVRLLLTEQPEE